MRHTASLSLPSIGPVRAAAPESEPFAIAANRQQPDALPALTPERLPTSPIASARLEGAVVAAHPRRPSQEPTRPSGAFELARRRRIVGLQISPVLIAAEHTESDVMIGATAISNHAVPKDGNRFFFPMYLPPYSRRRLPNPASHGPQRNAPQVGAAEFFSQYEPHFWYAVLHFGGEAALRAVIAGAGLQIDDDLQIKAYLAGDDDCVIARFRNIAAASSVGPHVLPSEEARHCIEQLTFDAQIASSRSVLARRPTVPVLAAAATPAEVIDAVLGRSQGMAVGEAHHAIGSKKFLIDHMPRLWAHGVQTLFMEHLLSDDHQAALDDWHASPPGSPMPSVIAAYLRDLDGGHMQEHCVDMPWRERYRELRQSYCFTALAKAAQQCGIKIVAADCHASYGVHESGLDGTAESAHTRTEVMNYFASEKIQRRDLPGKWIALVGNTHANTYEGVPGIAEQTGTLAVVVKDKLNTEDEPAVKNRVDNFSPGMQLDIVVAMKWD